ncbi:uncharacterized protein [Littorina saxatilis]|uniref:ShKT domain-containing protein n=1 Tax=Littorina saxatilis TaxID=31220 RepID=A0AAN9GJX6_9CAEN
MINFSVFVQFALVAVLLSAERSQGQTASTSKPCVNTEDTQCYRHRREEICEGAYKGWASVRCARYCGFCTDSQPDERCVDTIPNCNEYMACDDPGYFAWVGDHCRKFCNRCDVQVTATTPPAVQQTTPPKIFTTTSKPTSSAPASTQASRQTTSQGQGATATSAGGATCTDQLAFCDTYSKDACQNVEWAKNFCPRYCDLCASVTSTPSLTSRAVTTARPTPVTTSRAPVSTTKQGVATCTDQLAFCDTYSKDACQNVEWAKNFCPRYCDLCASVTSAPSMTSHDVTTARPTPVTTSSASSSTTKQAPATCRDQLPYCNTYSRDACANMDWAKNFCPNFCNVCDPVTPGSVVTSGPVVTSGSGMTSHGETTARPAIASSTLSVLTTRQGSSACVDQLSFCVRYSKDACNDTQWGRTYCASYCNLCVN